jgi:hypothetical protein
VSEGDQGENKQLPSRSITDDLLLTSATVPLNANGMHINGTSRSSGLTLSRYLKPGNPFLEFGCEDPNLACRRKKRLPTKMIAAVRRNASPRKKPKG